MEYRKIADDIDQNNTLPVKQTVSGTIVNEKTSH